MGEIENIENIKNKINIRDITSSFIIKRIFSFLSKKPKLNMIIYNKEFQKIFSVDIEDYKNIGKYIIKENNGKGREYIIDTNILIFEGEYLNRKRNGKGKEYYRNGRLMFEGEYINGKRWNGKGYKTNGIIEYEIRNGNGKGKEEIYNSELMFEGEYLNGEKNGKGKEYDYFDRLKFEGEYLNGERNGKGKEYYYDDKLKFEGEYLNGKRWNGKGYDKNGYIELEIRNGNGKGK